MENLQTQFLKIGRDQTYKTTISKMSIPSKLFENFIADKMSRSFKNITSIRAIYSNKPFIISKSLVRGLGGSCPD